MAASSSGIRLGKGFVEMFSKDSALLKSLDTIKSKLQAIAQRQLEKLDQVANNTAGLAGGLEAVGAALGTALRVH